ncbi:MAG: hypothetical protein NTY03_15015 [Candidatus Bathyarchaeota archaeon]|nr:hypothetical protein [Candidatus Bathyarchaeota archaeon]
MNITTRVKPYKCPEIETIHCWEKLDGNKRARYVAYSRYVY